MREWLVSIDYRGPSSITISPDALDELSDALSADRDDRVAVGGGPGWVRITLVVAVDNPADAWRPLTAAVLKAWPTVIAIPPWDMAAATLADAEHVEDLWDRQDRLPEIVGVAEAAEILEISAAAMANRVSRGSIVPDARISSGPVWARSTIEKLAGRDSARYTPGSK